MSYQPYAYNNRPTVPQTMPRNPRESETHMSQNSFPYQNIQPGKFQESGGRND